MARNSWKIHKDLNETIMEYLQNNVISTIADLKTQINRESDISYGTIKRALNSLKTQNKAILVMLPNQKAQYWTTTSLLNSQTIQFICPKW